ncbi:hypothetical protein HMPREF9446_03720 [Bacteroides fluxus YIT 12057]|uniref:Uncharacterized protein n=1 Tax=Bacteroides fluxus YIT 12057 TaxID=763034 RepID=F3PY72_9BACE|nr:hypothetical protein HMPREF9446_03720 [Bacteroides fluxus YIT 12057]
MLPLINSQELFFTSLYVSWFLVSKVIEEFLDLQCALYRMLTFGK